MRGALPARAGMKPVVLEPRGLALLNGTQAMAASGPSVYAPKTHAHRGRAGAMTLEACAAAHSVDERILAPAQSRTVGSSLTCANSSARRDQRVASRNDPRAGRLQLALHAAVHGEARGARLTRARSWKPDASAPITRSSRDGRSFIGRQFSPGAPLALALDYAAIAVTDLASISERRIERIVTRTSTKGCLRF